MVYCFSIIAPHPPWPPWPSESCRFSAERRRQPKGAPRADVVSPEAKKHTSVFLHHWISLPALWIISYLNLFISILPLFKKLWYYHYLCIYIYKYHGLWTFDGSLQQMSPGFTFSRLPAEAQLAGRQDGAPLGHGNPAVRVLAMARKLFQCKLDGMNLHIL